MVVELMEAAKVADFDPNARFRVKYHQSPYDLLQVVEVLRVGFQNIIKAESISPALGEPVFLEFTSEIIIVSAGDFFSYDGTKVYFLNLDTFCESRRQSGPRNRSDCLTVAE
jgi:hypothetical protein